MSAMSGVPSVDFSDMPVDDQGLDVRDEAARESAVAAIEMEEELLSQRCFQAALEMIQAYEAGEAFDLAKQVRELFDYADDVRLGPSSRAILDAAVERGIPYYRLTAGSLVQLGEGRYQRRIWTAETDATSAIAESIASDKDLTKRLLAQVGVPVPLGRMVDSPEDAWQAAQEVGMPVVVKPRNANHQRGISIELEDRDDILRAYHWAIEDGQTQDVMVEQFARGQHHRLLVVGNAMVAACRGHTETVVGDGTHTVTELVGILNQDPRRGEAYTDPLSVVKLDSSSRIELGKQGLTVDSIPEEGRVVLISRTGDLTTDCTEAVHPETARQAVLAARVIGLDIAGLDILAEDIGIPLQAQRGAVVEVNAGPSLTPHVTPLFGRPQPVGSSILEMLFPDECESRMQIVAVLTLGDSEGDSDGGETLMECWRQHVASGRVVARVTQEGGVVGERSIPMPRANLAARVQAVLLHPDAECLLLPLDLSQLARHACPVQRIDRLVIGPKIAQHRDRVAPSAWRTLLHAMHPATRFEWLGVLPADRARLESFLKP
jgi:cyanophycin synthetase